MVTYKNNIVMSRFSTVSALLALFYTVIYFIPMELSAIEIRVGTTLFIFLPFQIILFFIVVIIFFGSYWILETHPNLIRRRNMMRQVLPNIVLPTMSVLIFSFILAQTSKGITWWGLLCLGVFFYMLILYSEYQVLKPDVSSGTVFTILLIGLAHALFMVLAIAMRASISRIFVLAPALVLVVTFVVFRTLFLRSGGKVRTYWIVFVTFIIGQFAVSLYYLFITPNQYGLTLTAILFSCNALTARIGHGDQKKLFIEPLAMSLFLILWIILSKIN